MSKVIFVDDDDDLRRMLQYAFEGKGFEAIGLATGTTAVEYLMNEENLKEAVLLVLDRMLPDMDGMEILKKFKEKYGDRLPILFLSSLSAEKDVVQGLKLGAFDYIGKPFNITVFMEKALSLISRGKDV